ncbi:MAG TPA: hypothetical protein VGX71_25470 [Pseudaminobacter sp.]|nr:hypothetical protein [Pseudaminobacter sp.]
MARTARYTRKALPGQLPLFPLDMEPAAPTHDATGMQPGSVAAWVLEHGTQRLTRRERTFLFGIKQGRFLSIGDLQTLSDLHHRIGGRALPLQLSQQWR